jgi:hypothetical protein
MTNTLQSRNKGDLLQIARKHVQKITANITLVKDQMIGSKARSF